MRVLVAGLIDVAALGAVGGVAILAEGLTGRIDLLLPVMYVVLSPVVAWLAPKVSYRRRDALITPWVFLIIAWRIAYLPYRDWAPRDDEAGRARYLRSVEFGYGWIPEYAGLWRLEPTGPVSR